MRIALYGGSRPVAQGLALKFASQTYHVEEIVDVEDLAFWGPDHCEAVVAVIGANDHWPTFEQTVRGARIEHWRTPLLVLDVSKHGVRTACDYLNLGCDDVVFGDYCFEELLARLRAIVRRSNGFACNTVTIGDLTIDFESHRATVGETALKLTGYEAKILSALARNEGRTLSKNLLMDTVWVGSDADSKIVDVYICKLRKKLREAGGNPAMIGTVWGRGYFLTGTPKEVYKIPKTERLTHRILSALTTSDDPLPPGVLRETLNAETNSFNACLSQMNSAGLVERIGRRPTSTYKITSAGKNKLQGEAA